MGTSRVRVSHVTTVPVSLMFLRGQPAFMSALGYELRVVSSPGAELDEFGRRESVPVHAVPMERRITPLKDIVALARLFSHFLRTKPDIVHAHTPKGGLLGMLASTFARVPVRIYHMRGAPFHAAKGVRRWLLTATEWTSCRLATEVICVSHSLRSDVLARGLCPASRARVLAGGSGQGVDAEGRFDPRRLPEGARERARRSLGVPTDAVVFGFVGRIVREKGVGELVAAWRRVREELPDARLVLVGPFEAQDPIAPGDRRALEEDERVVLTGFRTDTPELYLAADVVVLPTYREGFPNVPLEAAAMERPAIVTRVTGCVDAVEDGITGMFVPKEDATALADAMLRYGRDPGLRLAHGSAGRERVLRSFRRTAIWEAIAERYAALIAARGREPGGERTWRFG